MSKKVSLLLSLLFIAMGTAFSQENTIRGTVISSEDGQPVAGASILVKGTLNGTTSKNDGTFSLSNVSPSSLLEVTFIGMKGQEIKPTSKVLRIVLEPDTRLLDEVMVIAYGSIKKSAFTGSAAEVGNERLQTPAASFDKALAGQVAGVQVMSASGQPGSATSIRVRGSGSLSASNEPLYVVDGVALTALTAKEYSYNSWDYDSSSNPLASINPNDIESITVLKDAAAAALYGSRAANGVVLITTKSGKQGSAKVTFSAEYTWSGLSKAYDLMNSSEYYKTLFNGYLANGYSASEANSSTQGALTHNPYNVSEPLDASGNVVSGAKIVVDTDWQDEVFNTALTKNYNVNLGGAREKTDYFFSLGYSDQEGLTPGSNFERYSGKMNVNSQVNKWFKAGMNASLSYSIQNTSMAGGAGASSMLNALQFPNAVPLYIVDDNGSPVLDSDGKKQYNYTNPVAIDFNPVSIPNMDVSRSKFYRIIASAYAQIDFYKDLNFKTTLSPDYLSTDETIYWNKEHGNGPAYNGRLDKYHRVNLSYTSSNTLNYHHSFGMSNLNVLGGMEYWQSKFESLYAGGRDILGDFQELSVAGGSFAPSSETAKETMISYFGRAEYSYKDRYNASASLRTDGSSVFGANNKWGTFWSVGGNWRINREVFLSSVSAIDDLKLRASYGTSGNKAGIERYASLGLWEGDTESKYSTNTGINHKQLANAELSWEKQKMFNVGIDFGFWGRFYGSVDYFNKVSDGLLYAYPMAISNGFTSITMNVAKTSNHGFEFAAGGHILTGAVKWDADLNASIIRDKIKDLNGDDDVKMTDYQKIWSVGGSQYEFYMPTWAGVDASNGDALWYTVDANGTRSKTSDYSKATYERQGRSTPDVYGGFNNTLSYKNFSLGIQFTYAFGGKVYDGIYSDLMHDGSTPGVNMSTEALDAWTSTNTDTNVPKFSIHNSTGSSSLSTRYLYKATNVKLKHVTLSYNVPKTVPYFSQVFSGARVWVSADNLLTWFADKGYKGYDDLDLFGIQGYADYPSIPTPRSFSVGINLTF